jgi:hypothetical protein
MDQTEVIERLRERIKVTEREKLEFQKLAQDKIEFIEILTSNDKRYPGFTGAKELYDTARELIETMHLEKMQRIKTVNKLDDIFETGKQARKT